MSRSLLQPRLGLCLAALVVALTTACPGDVPVGGGHSRFDGGLDLLADSTPLDQAPADLDLGQEGTPDLPRDLVPPRDLAPDVLPADLLLPPSCSTSVDMSTLVLLTFESSTGGVYPNMAGQKHEATLQGGAVTPIPGGIGCGTALQMVAANKAYLEISHDKDFDLSEGSLDLWVRFDMPGTAGLISKDAAGTNQDGHLTLYRLCDGGIAVRQQQAGQSYYRCTDPVPDSKWMHIGVNFGSGGLELFVDGQAGLRASGVACDSSVTCGGTLAKSIAPNKNPWVIGASSVGSDDGDAEPVSSHLQGVIDSVRISKKPRVFGTP